MGRLRTICAVAAATALTLGAVALVAPGTASAQPVTAGTLTMTSDPGDHVGGGESYAYAAGGDDQFVAYGSTSRSEVAVNVGGWILHVAAPDYGVLVPGTYAVGRYPFQDPGLAGLEVTGFSRGCNTITGTVTVTELTWTADDLLSTLALSFEQHCDGAAAALRGTLDVVVGRPAPTLVVGATLARKGRATADGATVSGTVTCSKPTPVQVSAVLTQQRPAGTVNGGGGVPVRCVPGTAVRWTLTAPAYGELPFGSGPVTVQVEASGWDLDEGISVSATAAGTVRLRT